MRILIILHLLIIICVCVFFMQLRFTFEKFGNINVDIGNRICEYFFNLGSSIMKKHDFNSVPDYTGITFFDNLPKIIPYNPEEFDKIHDAFIAKNINDDLFKSDCGGCSAWEITNNKIYNFWKIMHPLVQSIMNEAFLKSDLKKKVDCPIIHFRCADTPFIKQNGYHFQYYTFFEEALKEITKKSNVNYSKVILMSCNTHNSDVEKQNACVDYTDSLNKHLNEIGYECDVMCGTNIDDFAMLFYAPAVISTSSSFSFMSGFFGKGLFFSTENTNGKCTDCNEFMLYNYNLMHDQVEDYSKVDSVIQLLQK